MPAKGHKHALDALGPGGSISRGTQYGKKKVRILEEQVRTLKAALYAVAPRDIAILRESGTLPESKRELADVAAAEVLRLRRAAEGEPGSSSYRPLAEGQAAALRVAERHLLLGLCEQARALQSDDGESASRAGAQFSKFLAVLKDSIGLGPREVDVPDLGTYLAKRASENGADKAIDINPDALPTEATASPSDGNEGGEPRCVPPAVVLSDSNDSPDSGE
jgi:hypothetical protein